MLWWDESLATGIYEIDQQHRNIFSKVDEILALDNSMDFEAIKEKFSFLISYMTDHFSKEEAAMINSYYDGFKDHRDKHTYLVNQIFDLKLEFKKNTITDETLDNIKLLIVEWLVKHIDEDDRAMAEYIKQYI